MPFKKGSGFEDKVSGINMIIILLIVGSIIGIGLVILGIVLLVTKGKYSASTTAQILEVDCVKHTGTCLLKLSFSVNNNNYTTKTTAKTSNQYQTGSSINIRYNQKDPSEVIINSRRKLFGWISLGIGIGVIILAIVPWLLKKFRKEKSFTDYNSKPNYPNL